MRTYTTTYTIMLLCIIIQDRLIICVMYFFHSRLVQIAKEEKVSLIGMAFGISHLVQPLDDDVSDMIKNAFNK